MKRRRTTPRPNWKEKLESIGFSFHSVDGKYWVEEAYYELTTSQIDYLDDVTAEVQQMCLETVRTIIETDSLRFLRIPERYYDAIRKSWERQDPSIYGRFDFAFDGTTAKLLEYNADTPTSLLETSVAQWHWLQDNFPEADQFNSVHEKLLETFQKIRLDDVFYFTSMAGCEEDFCTTRYLQDVATQAGLTTSFIEIENIRFDHQQKQFIDANSLPIRNLFKLYPLEFMVTDAFGQYVPGAIDHLFEPFWKLIMSNKGFLKFLWDQYPGHPNLLETRFTPFSRAAYVRKPKFSREGANVSIIQNGALRLSTPGTYNVDDVVYQAYTELPEFDGKFPIIGSWVIGNKPAGIGIREDATRITTNTSRFVPHLFRP